jgi:Protein of unknown function (DUF2815)
MAERKNIVTPEFRVGWPSVFELKINELSGKMECWLTALFPKDADLSGIRALAKQAAIEAWGSDIKKWPKITHQTLRDQIELAKNDENGDPTILREGLVSGAMFCRLKSRNVPGLVDVKMQKIIDPVKFYGGCWARAEITAFPYDFKKTCGVSLWMNNILKTRDDEPLGGRRRAEDVFQTFKSAESSGGDDFLNEEQALF